MAFIEDCLRACPNKKTVERTEKEFKSLIRLLAKKASKGLGEGLNKIYFRMMKTKWASCSARRNLTINRLMRFLPEPLLNYVIFHEIAHLKIKDTVIGFGSEYQRNSITTKNWRGICSFTGFALPIMCDELTRTSLNV